MTVQFDVQKAGRFLMNAITTGRYTCKLVSPLVSATDPDAAVLPALEIHDPHFVQTHWKATWIEG